MRNNWLKPVDKDSVTFRTFLVLFTLKSVELASDLQQSPVDHFRSLCRNDCQELLFALPKPGQTFTGCDWNCKKHECKNGCDHWNGDYDAKFNCQSICSNTNNSCSSGCHDVESRKIGYVKDMVKNAIVRKAQVTFNGIDITWGLNNPDIDGVTWKVEIKLIENDDSTWIFAKTNLGLSGTDIAISIPTDKLLALSRYLIRLVAFYQNRRIDTSIETQVKTLSADSKLSSKPVIIHKELLQPQFSYIICWNEPVEKNSPIKSYKISLETEASSILSDNINSTCYILSNLLAKQKYNVSIKAVNNAGESEAVQERFSTTEKKIPSTLLYYANTTHLMVIDDVSDFHKDPRLVYQTIHGVQIECLKTLAEEVLLSLSNNSLISVSSDSKVKVVLSSAPSAKIILSDELREQFYLFMENQIHICESNNFVCNITKLNFPVLTAVLDNIYTQFAYYSTKDGLFGFALGHPDTVKPLDYFDLKCNNLAIDFATGHLVCNSENKVLNYNLISNKLDFTKSDLLRPGTQRIYGKVVRMVSWAGKLFWISSPCSEPSSENSCLFTDEKLNNDRFQINNYLLPLGHGALIDLDLAFDINPSPVLMPPSNVSALFASSSAQVSWNKPSLLPFQADFSSIHFKYNLELLTNSVLKKDTVSDQYKYLFDHGGLKSNTQFDINLNICASNHCSQLETASGSTFDDTFPLQKLDIFIITKKSTYVFTPLGENTITIESENTKDVNQFITSGPKGKGFISTLGGNIYSFNYNNEQYILKSNMTNLTSFDYDPFGDTFYWAQDNGIYRSPSQFDSVETLFPEANTKCLKVFKESELPLLIVGTDSVLYSVYLTGLYNIQYFGCQIHDCQLLGFDFNGPTIIYVYHQENQIFIGSISSDGTKKAEKRAENFPFNFKKIVYYYGKFLMLMDSGKLGIVEADGKSINFIQIDDKVEDFSLAMQRTLFVESLPLVADVKFASNKDGDEVLEWTVDRPKFVPFYKIEIFNSKSKIDNDLRNPLLTTITDSNSVQMKGLKFNDYNVSLTIFNYRQLNTTYWSMKPKVDYPSRPTNPRIYSTVVKTPYNSSASVQFIWEPSIWNGSPLGFKVYCYSFNNNNNQPRTYYVAGSEVDFSSTMFNIDNLPLGITIFCQVCAGNIEKGYSRNLTTPVSISTYENKPPPLLLLATSNELGLYDMTKESFILSTTNVQEVNYSIAYVQQKIYITKSIQNSMKLFSTNISQSMEILTGIGQTAQINAITGDWIGNNIYLGGIDSYSTSIPTIWKLNLDENEKQNSAKIYDGIVGNKIQSLVFDALNSYLYFAQDNHGVYTVYRLDTKLYDQQPTVLNCDIISSALMMNYTDPLKPTLIGLTTDGLVEMSNCHVTISHANFDVNLKSVKKMALDLNNVYLLTHVELLIYNVSSGQNSKIDIVAADMVAFTDAYLPFPDINCLVIPSGSYNISVRPISDQSIEIIISPFQWPDKCSRVSRPAIFYNVTVKPVSEASCDKSLKCFTKETTSTSILINDLSAASEYEVQANAYNIYSDKMFPSSSLKFKRSTGQSDNSPRNFSAFSVSPIKIMLFWSPPKLSGRYRYALVRVGESNPSLNFNIGCDTQPPCNVSRTANPSTTYRYVMYAKLIVDHADIDAGISNEATVTTFSPPGNLVEQQDKRTSNSLTYLWTPQDTTHVTNLDFYYRKISDSTWSAVSQLNGADVYTLSNLQPDTQYEIQMIALYQTSNKYNGVNYPKSENYTKILATRKTEPVNRKPDAPDNVNLITTANQKSLTWTKPFDGGKDISHYIIEYKYDDKSEWIKPEFSLVSGALTSVPIPAKFNMTNCSQFRVSANNRNGLSTPSVFVLPTCKSPQKAKSNAVGIVVGVSVTCLIVVIVIIVLIAIRKKRNKPSNPTTRSGNLNLTYVPQPITSDNSETLKQIGDKEIKSLPHVPRSCITISKLLGSGAFGEVFEGLAYNLQRTGQKSVRVAVKTLRPGSSDVERVKFLKEAVLMTNLNHSNIVRLLGVCLESEPHWIILELMEAGSLLSYLRSVRPSDTMPSQVSFRDLVQISLDVAKGCGYLEELHHVHRDLASRNCLITSRDPSLRVVKIADFGLARDVYDGDYYRVEGQGLLPVRWMAPESLLDGVFTSKSDVWSYGILLWEVMTLGKQPYQGKSNWDVINYVRLGGRLDPPECCFDEIYQIMEYCWAFDAPARPKFKEIIEKLETLKVLDQFLDDSPFPPFYSRPTSLNSQENSQSNSSIINPPTSAGSETPIFSTQSSGRFTRKEASGQSNRQKNKPKQTWFDSLRGKKETAPPPPLPTKEEISGMSSPRTSNQSSASGLPTVSSTQRPDSGISGQSFTTTAEGYEVPLLKNVVSNAMVGADNQGYEPYKRRDRTSPHMDAATGLNIQLPSQKDSIALSTRIPMTNFPKKPYENV